MKKTKITAAIMIALAGSVMVTSAESAEVKAGFHHGHEWREPPRREWHEPPPSPPPPHHHHRPHHWHGPPPPPPPVSQETTKVAARSAEKTILRKELFFIRILL